MSRPEHQAPPEVFYNEGEAKKYLTSSRMVEIQTKLSERCLELLALDSPNESRLLLDIGCGTGLSGDVLSEHGHHWVGLDISESMLGVAVKVRDVQGDLFARDMGDGVGMFRTGVFDGAISVSALQWLCNVDSTGAIEEEVGGNVMESRELNQRGANDEQRVELGGRGTRDRSAVHRLNVFFASLYCVLRKGSRAVFQFYPENADQLELITSAAMRNGFSGGVVVDFPNSAKAKKYYLCLNAGPPDQTGPRNEDVTEPGGGRIHSSKRERPRKKSQLGRAFSTREWIIEKKERQRRVGKTVRSDSKYSGRKRSKKF
uniref:18S rRNA (guanine(1575)-N(7))-methyltransferase Bud23 C-terminal domain-containing protein n=1 Tax=Compsopogon caeruleus TaxID=31354 RepID=A0A7S1TDM7_9RHOD|mmetsp:Transcript_2398/g.4149  ORF Transcript_2398/g.4149 Transcript_2398/m.4149 type:complete len:316 (+) Transcript_2398:68-1015(+)